MTDRMDVSPLAGKNTSRRRTLPPETFRQLQASPPIPYKGVNFSRPFPPGRRDESFPYQAHQARRSLTSSYTLQLASSPQSPWRSRRTSFADMSPLLHAPMVGSYEESILRGRMSTTPSKPLDFTAQIGVLGKGNCKPNLRCPPHVTVPFPAVFYSYQSSGSGRSIADDSPSPYVGMIDLENSLPGDTAHDGRRRRRLPSSPAADPVERDLGEYRHHQAKSGRKNERRGREKRWTRPESLKAPPGGCYRIPQQGQLQIVIKNPNKTAVKLFLVPYDLADMEPGTKTFIRQRCYSTGPVIDMPLTAKQNLMGADPDQASAGTDKPTLRYLIHVNICSPSKGRFYLYSSIRVVFANRVPDGKEKLRNEIQHPDPRYSPYKPAREVPFSPAGARSVVEKAFRRRSLGMGLGGQMMVDGITHVPSPYPRPLRPDFAPEASPVPLQLSTSGNEQTPVPGDDAYRERGYPWLWKPSQSSFGSFEPTGPSPDISRLDTSRRSSSPCINSPESNTELYHKLSKGDVGYGGYPFGPLSGGSEVGESLLAKRLRGLDVKIQRIP